MTFLRYIQHIFYFIINLHLSLILTNLLIYLQHAVKFNFICFNLNLTAKKCCKEHVKNIVTAKYCDSTGSRGTERTHDQKNGNSD